MKFATPIFDGATEADIDEQVRKLVFQNMVKLSCMMEEQVSVPSKSYRWNHLHAETWSHGRR
jgi:hypothetical protein